MIRNISTDMIFVLFRCETLGCPDVLLEVETPVSSLVKVGNPICWCCEVEMVCIGLADVQTEPFQ